MPHTHIYSGKIRAKTGVAAVLESLSRTFIDQKKSASKVLALDSALLSGDFPISDVTGKGSARDESGSKRWRNILIKIRKYLYKKAESNPLSAAVILLLHLSNGIKVARQLKGGETVVAHDIWSLFGVVILRRKYHEIYLVLHNDGDLIATIRSVYKSLPDCFFKNVFAPIFNRLISNLDGVVLLSRLALENFKQSYPLEKTDLYVIPNGIEMKNLDASQIEGLGDTFSIHITGTVCDRKRQYLIPRIMHESQSLGGVSVNIWGDGPDLDCLREKAADLGINNLIFHGSTESPHRHYKPGDFFLLLSKNEGLSVAVLEAMRAGCIPILTETGANSEIVERCQAYIVKNESDDQIVRDATAILQEIACLGASQRNCMAVAAARAFAQFYTVDAMVSQYETLGYGLEVQTGALD